MKNILYTYEELQEKFTSEVAKWFSDNGDQTLRVNYQLSENSNVIDLGGYEGKWSKKIQDIYGCNVHIFEPIPEFYENIKKLFSDNKKVYFYQWALGECDKECIIYHNRGIKW